MISLSLSLIAHLGLKSLYKKGYSFRDASEIMAISPLLLISLILPILKLEIMFADPIDVTIADTQPLTESVNPNTHEVSGYTRISPDGNVQEVSGYIRTNPDGIVENNISYHGNTLHSTNHGIHEYVRAMPEGVSEVSTIVEGYKPNKSKEEIEKDSPIVMTPAQQKKQKLQAALRQLPPSERKLLAMLYGQKRDLQSIANESGCSLHELNIRLEQAHKLLQHQMLLANQS